MQKNAKNDECWFGKKKKWEINKLKIAHYIIYLKKIQKRRRQIFAG